jgi:hypothetical protein
VADLAALISLSAHLRAEGADGDGAAWAATAVLLGEGVLADGRARSATATIPARCSTSRPPPRARTRSGARSSPRGRVRQRVPWRRLRRLGRRRRVTAPPGRSELIRGTTLNYPCRRC